MKPIIKWVGGKTQILNQVFEKFPKKINNYHETFLGGGSVLLELIRRVSVNEIQITGKIYAYDINSVLIHMFINIRDNPVILQNVLKNFTATYMSCVNQTGIKKKLTEAEGVSSKESYYYWMRLNYNKMTLVDKISVAGSALFIFLNKTCYRGLYRIGPNGLNSAFGNYMKLNLIITDIDLNKMSEAIQTVEFLVSDFNDSLKNVKITDFVYLDPPYVPISKTSSFVGYALGGFNDIDHTKLFNLIHNLNSRNIKFLLSNSDAQKVQNVFINYESIQIECRRVIDTKKSASKIKELLICN
ncbi:S-adenosyl-L-methionine-dependent methyltransferase [Pelagophyceae sp. CCMP2097]|nr:S-adenosyl-L-methionine-dependent methyltransferase [Pelagophyceae sp. CCMP2097]